MKLPNFLIHTFAAVGVISLIFWGCAAADSDNIDNPPQLTEEYGKYQVAVSTSLGMVILNTETGVLKSYYRNLSTNGEWLEGYQYNTANIITGAGNLTVNH
jgi:hypothetical protein